MVHPAEHDPAVECAISVLRAKDTSTGIPLCGELSNATDMFNLLMFNFMFNLMFNRFILVINVLIDVFLKTSLEDLC